MQSADSTHQLTRKDRRIAAKGVQPLDKDKRPSTWDEQLEKKDQQLAERDKQLMEKDRLIQHLRARLAQAVPFPPAVDVPEEAVQVPSNRGKVEEKSQQEQ